MNGNIGTARPSFPYGPYIQQQLPIEPFNGMNTVTATAVSPPTAATSAGGWYYNTTTGMFQRQRRELLESIAVCCQQRASQCVGINKASVSDGSLKSRPLFWSGPERSRQEAGRRRP